MHLIDGRALAAKIRQETQTQVAAMSVVPTLAILLVGDDAPSHIYVSLKEKAAKEMGVKTIVERVPTQTTDEDLLARIDSWNKDASIHAILVQVPLPEHHDQQKIVEAIDPKKDADGFHPVNRTALLSGGAMIIPPVHEGILRLIAETPLHIHGSRVCLVMNSEIFSAPLARLLTLAGASVITMSAQELDYKALAEADAIVVAVGQRNLINVAMTKTNVVLIDVGTNPTPDGKVTGDVDRASFETSDAWISPVPGGVGPMTIAQLFKNVVLLAERATTSSATSA